MADVKFEIVKRIKVLSEGKTRTKEFNLVKWGFMDPIYDIRKWEEDVPGKGITLTKEEAEELYYALSEELGLK